MYITYAYITSYITRYIASQYNKTIYIWKNDMKGYPGITWDNPIQKTCNGISQYRNLVLGYLGISWDIPSEDNSVQDGI